MPISSPICTDGRAIDRVLGAGLPVMLVFAERRSATRERLWPILARLAAAYAGCALIAELNADNHHGLARRYGVCLFAGPGAR